LKIVNVSPNIKVSPTYKRKRLEQNKEEDDSENVVLWK